MSKADRIVKDVGTPILGGPAGIVSTIFNVLSGLTNHTPAGPGQRYGRGAASVVAGAAGYQPGTLGARPWQNEPLPPIVLEPGENLDDLNEYGEPIGSDSDVERRWLENHPGEELPRNTDRGKDYDWDVEIPEPAAPGPTAADNMRTRWEPPLGPTWTFVPAGGRRRGGKRTKRAKNPDGWALIGPVATPPELPRSPEPMKRPPGPYNPRVPPVYDRRAPGGPTWGLPPSGPLITYGSILAGVLWPNTTASDDTVLKGRARRAKQPRARDLPVIFQPGYPFPSAPESPQSRRAPVPAKRPAPVGTIELPGPVLEPVVTTARRLPVPRATPGTATRSRTTAPIPPATTASPLTGLLTSLLPYLPLAPRARPGSALPVPDVLSPIGDPVLRLLPADPIPYSGPSPYRPPIKERLPLTSPAPVGVGFSSPGFASTDECLPDRARRKPTRKCVKRDSCNKCIKYAPL